jgi:hypothetical protein
MPTIDGFTCVRVWELNGTGPGRQNGVVFYIPFDPPDPSPPAVLGEPAVLLSEPVRPPTVLCWIPSPCSGCDGTGTVYDYGGPFVCGVCSEDKP